MELLLSLAMFFVILAEHCEDVNSGGYFPARTTTPQTAGSVGPGKGIFLLGKYPPLLTFQPRAYTMYAMNRVAPATHDYKKQAMFISFILVRTAQGLTHRS